MLPSRIVAREGEPFADFDAADLALIGAWFEHAAAQWPQRRTRRREAHPHGRFVDLRASMNAARRTGWEPMRLVHSRPRRRPRRHRVDLRREPVDAAVRVDLSAPDARRRAPSGPGAEVFAFATTVTRLTPVLTHRSAEVAIARANRLVTDRYGGTHIAASLRTVLASPHGSALRGAVVVIGSDGWDSDEPAELAAAMTRVRRRAHRVVWLNPAPATRCTARWPAPWPRPCRTATPSCPRIPSRRYATSCPPSPRHLDGRAAGAPKTSRYGITRSCVFAERHADRALGLGGTVRRGRVDQRDRRCARRRTVGGTGSRAARHPDPGPVTTYGLPALRAVGEGAAVVAIGSLLLSAFLVPPQRSGVLDADGYRSLRIAGNAALVWAVCALLLIPLSISDVSGQPLREVVVPKNLWLAFGQVEAAGVWRWTALLALLLVIGCRTALRWGWMPILLGLGLFSLMPLALTGHSSAGGAHDIATNSLIWHLVGASLWAGGLFAVLVHARRGGAHTDVAARRFSHVATVALIVMALSGLINALVRIPLSDVFTTTYGRLVLAKAVALIAIGCVGLAQRRKALPALAADPTSRSALIRFGGIEALLFAATVGLAVGLGRTPPPAGSLTQPSRLEVALGYDLAGPPTLARLLFDWRFDLIFGVAAVVLAVVYLLGVRRLHRRGDAWSKGRTLAWLLGCWCCWSGPRRGSAGTRPRCSACTWACTWRCRCSRRSCWYWAARSPSDCGPCRPRAATVSRARGSGCSPRCTTRCRAFSPTR